MKITTLQVRSTLKAGKCASGGHFPEASNHNEVLKIRSTVKAGKYRPYNHNEALRRNVRWPRISMRRRSTTAARKEDRLQLLVVRAGLRGGWSWGKGRQ